MFSKPIVACMALALFGTAEAVQLDSPMHDGFHQNQRRKVTGTGLAQIDSPMHDGFHQNQRRKVAGTRLAQLESPMHDGFHQLQRRKLGHSNLLQLDDTMENPFSSHFGFPDFDADFRQLESNIQNLEDNAAVDGQVFSNSQSSSFVQETGPDGELHQQSSSAGQREECHNGKCKILNCANGKCQEVLGKMVPNQASDIENQESFGAMKKVADEDEQP